MTEENLNKIENADSASKPVETCKIYLLTNTINGKIYIGQTWLTFKKRMGTNGVNYNNSDYLYGALLKHGCENFVYSILGETIDQEEADEMEDFYINEYNSLNSEIGYNLKAGGRGGKHTDETKRKISESLKNKVWSSEAIEAKRTGGRQWLGKKRGPLSEERKQQNSEASKEWHENNVHPMLGKHHTEEAKEKISKTSTGRKRDPESVKRGAEKLKMPKERELAIIEKYQTGMNIKDIEAELNCKTSAIYRVLHRNNIPLSNNFKKWTGKKHTEETKEKMSDSMKEYWNKHDDDKLL